MNSKRDDFTATTKNILAQRVGYKCSNPTCRIQTSGPHSDPEKSLLLGVAAHITAASVGGPRYDDMLNKQERQNIANAIWLCPTCSILIDKDASKFTVDLLTQWKKTSESSALEELGKVIAHTSVTDRIPFLELDMIWGGGAKLNKGASSNPSNYQGPMEPSQVIWNNLLQWNYYLAIYNNSSFPAFNIKIIEYSGKNFNQMDFLPKVNNLKAFGDIRIKAKFEKFYQGTGRSALKLIDELIPPELVGKEIYIEYQDEDRKIHRTKATIKINGIENFKVSDNEIN